jgi:hypothetical protein
VTVAIEGVWVSGAVSSVFDLQPLAVDCAEAIFKLTKGRGSVSFKSRKFPLVAG